VEYADDDDRLRRDQREDPPIGPRRVDIVVVGPITPSTPGSTFPLNASGIGPCAESSHTFSIASRFVA
jgi:hypothetical protein